MRKKRHYAALLVAALLVAGCGESEKKQSKAPLRVETEVVVTDSLGGARTYVGIVEEREATAVSFTSMGVVQRVLVSEGQAVSRGQLIAEMDKTQARHLRDVAMAQMQQALDAQERYKQLHDAGSLPEVQWVEIQSKVEQAKSQFLIATKNVEDCRLVAPVSGVIGRKLVGAGETALPSQAVVTILDISTVKVKVAVPEAEVSTITATTPTDIEVDAIGGHYEGGRIEKGVVADVLTHTYDVRINVANSERRLLPGMVASVRFDTEAQPAGSRPLTLPVTAVQRRADGSLFVWTVAADSTAHRTPVTTGPTQGNRIAVSSGLEGGQRVVTEGYQKLSEGTKVCFAR